MKQFILSFVMLLSLSFSSFAASNNPPNDTGGLIVENTNQKVEAIEFNQTVDISNSLLVYETLSKEMLITNLRTNETLTSIEEASNSAYGNCINGREYYLCLRSVNYYPYIDLVPCSRPCGGEQ